MANDTSSSNQLERTRTSSRVTFVDDSGLRPLRARPRFSDYLRQIWKIRHYVQQDARGKSFSVGRGTFLGTAWIILNPAIQVSLYAFVFGLLLRADRGVDNFIGFLIIGVIFFAFINQGFSNGSMLIQRNRGLLTSFNFPKAAVVLSAALRLTLDNIAPAMLAVIGALIFQPTHTPSWTVVLVIPIFVLTHVMAAGFSFIFARLTAFIPDVNSLIQIITRILFFVSGVFAPVTRFVEHPGILRILEANPAYQVLDMTRTVVLSGQVPSIGRWAYLAAISISLFVLGLIFFWKAEHRYASVK